MLANSAYGIAANASAIDPDARIAQACNALLVTLPQHTGFGYIRVGSIWRSGTKAVNTNIVTRPLNTCDGPFPKHTSFIGGADNAEIETIPGYSSATT